MYVLGTAGHVDHGKSSLVKALTGIDPDRLDEEKARGLTIELGFAWLTLPSGREVSIVDVPGHERFIKNMLAGVGGIDIALLIVAADEGVMPQTREHLAILDLLNVHHGIIVITKKDLVDEEMLELVTMDAEDVLKGTALESAPIVNTSATTGEGLQELLSAIDTLLASTSQRRDIGKPRMAIDRVFTIKGFGTVVTGTLIDGRFSIGSQVEILPGNNRATIRGLQTHQKKLETAFPGSRVAVNLSGVAVEDLQKGLVITSPGWLIPSRYFDVKLRAIANLPRPIRHNKSISFHTGSAEFMGKVRLLDRDKLEAGESGWAQIVLTKPVAAVSGDFFIIRSSTATIGGGIIVDTNAKRHQRFHQKVIESLESREKGTPEDMFISSLAVNEPAEFGSVLNSTNLSKEDANGILKNLIAQDQVVMLGPENARALLFTIGGWNRLKTDIQQMLEHFHQQYPLRIGMPKEELRSRLKMSQQAFTDAVNKLQNERVFLEEGVLIRLWSHEVRFSTQQQNEVDVFLKSLEKNRYSPSPDMVIEPELLNALIDQKKIVKLGDNVVFSAWAYDEMVKRIVEHMKSNETITIAEVRDMFSTSRKYALAVMEHLDEQKVTRRSGDKRVLR